LGGQGLQSEPESTRLQAVGSDIGDLAMAIHYPRRVSNIKRRRTVGFRARMRTKSGRKIINGRRRIGRKVGCK